jgi:hypothetical protein
VQTLPQNLYTDWRAASGVFWTLRDDDDVPPERLLQSIWLHQRLCRDKLTTADGEPVKVLHPGFQSVEGGPDFCNAVIRIGGEKPVAGDIEVDLRTSGWRGHGHDRNPAFANVVLHVVWDAEKGSTGLPTLPLRKALDAPLGELSQWMATGSGVEFPEGSRGQCSQQLRRWPEERLQALLAQAAMVRLRAKASQFEARARQSGWDQSLWEGVFRGLGYKHNVWPMHCLAELRPRWSSPRVDAFGLEARLLGISGLLPLELTRAHPDADKYLRGLWDQWWREVNEFSDCVLPRTLWRFHGIRPANHPHRRLALAAQWVCRDNLTRGLERWCAASLSDGQMVEAMEELLGVPEHEFWSRRWTFRSKPSAKPQPLVGLTRITDLAVNVFLPWLWARAAGGGQKALQESIESRYLHWPAAEDNAVLRLARQRILGGVGPRAIKGAATQQGLMQIVQDFCGNSTSICEGCGLPSLLERAVNFTS